MYAVALSKPGPVVPFLMAITDITYAFTDLLFIILARAVLEDRDWFLISDARVQNPPAISLINWTTLARLVRGQMLSLQERDYVTAAGRWALRRHGLCSSTCCRYAGASDRCRNVRRADRDLRGSRSGLPRFRHTAAGDQPGPVVSDGYTYISANEWIVVFPAGAIAVLMLCFTFIGDGLRDALDPRTR